MRWKYILLCAILALIGCDKTIDKAELIEEIITMEKSFNDYAKTYGVKEAFLKFAHEEAVINRGDSIIEGFDGIRGYYENQSLTNVDLQWKPDFVDVAESGDMAYTYGKYTFKAMRADSSLIDATGIFHTVWKRDANGEWKYVYD